MDQKLNNTSEKNTNLDAYQALLQIEDQTKRLKKTSYWKAYILSIIFSPIGGIYYFIKFFIFSEDADAKKAAIVSLVLSIITLLVSIFLLQLIFSQLISTSEDDQNLIMIKELLTPENQRSLQQLLQ